MTEEEKYYIENKFKISENDMSTWRYFPIGELKRKIYDYHNLNLDEFLIRYYKNYEQLDFWTKKWMKNIVLPVFVNDSANWKRYNLDVNNKDYLSWFDDKHNVMVANMNKNKSLDFDEDVILFISYLETFGFFQDINLTLENWLSSKKINSGGLHRQEEDLYSLNEIAQEMYGNNLVRDKLMSLEWHKR